MKFHAFDGGLPTKPGDKAVCGATVADGPRPKSDGPYADVQCPDCVGVLLRRKISPVLEAELGRDGFGRF